MSNNKDKTRSRKIWIDTDAGTDDAIALMLAMTNPDVEIIGLSTVGGNVDLDCVTQNVLYIQELFGNKAPVYAGSAQPLKRKLDLADFIHGKDGLGDIGLPLNGRIYNNTNAVEALLHATTKHKGEIDMITLGPLTNLAKAISQDKNVIKNIKHCYIMGGLISGPGNVTPRAEYNIWADPEAAQIVLKAKMHITMIGWDTTVRSGYLTLKELADLRSIGTFKAKITADMQMVRVEWQKKEGHNLAITWADPTAMAVMLYPDIILDHKKVIMSVHGGDDSDPNRGVLKIRHDKNGPITHITNINRDTFISLIRDAMM